MSASRKSSSASSPPGPPPYEAQLDKETHIRLLAEKEDFQRRIKERDARSTELQKTADAAEKKAQKAAEARQWSERSASCWRPRWRIEKTRKARSAI